MSGPLTEHGFYSPNDWTDDQLRELASRLDPVVPIDLGIVRAVQTLLDSGVETFESCEGGPAHAFAEPTVRFYGDIEEGWKALSVCLTFRFPVKALRRYWTVSINGEPTGPHWELGFRRKLLNPVPRTSHNAADSPSRGCDANS